jgi:hypothetical protein
LLLLTLLFWTFLFFFDFFHCCTTIGGIASIVMGVMDRRDRRQKESVALHHCASFNQIAEKGRKRDKGWGNCEMRINGRM